MKRFIDANVLRIAYDAVEAPTFLAAYDAEIKVVHEYWPNIHVHALREHARLVFHWNTRS
jgi:peptide chain release factor 3